MFMFAIMFVHFRVDAMQSALATFTGLAAADQICMVKGAKMDPTRTLGAYRLPAVSM